MKKYLLLFAYLLFITIVVKATDWFPVGAKWTWDYNTCCQGQRYTSKWEITKDTIINTDTFKLMEIYENQFGNRERVYIIEKNKMIQRWHENQLLPICDFNKNENDTLEVVGIGHNGLDTLVYVIDSIRTSENNILQIQYVHAIYMRRQSTPLILPPGGIAFQIMERALFYSFNCLDCFINTDGSYDIDLRCYQDDEFEFGSHNYNCDTLLANSKQSLNSNFSFNIFPNPATNKIHVYNNLNKYFQTATVTISGVDSKVLYYRQYKDNTKFQDIDVSRFNNGMYLIRIEIDSEYITRAFIVNH